MVALTYTDPSVRRFATQKWEKLGAIDVPNLRALLATVLENPADDTARLILAYLLRESDDPHEQAPEPSPFSRATPTTPGYPFTNPPSPANTSQDGPS